jgi:Raf kinase inhibitor-like YbhB/YbcL family protein
MTFTITSPAFEQNGEIPARYTCEGENISPPLNWSGAPAGTESLVLIVEDPDAPDPAAPRMIWVHWILYNIPAATTGLAEAIRSDRLPGAAGEGFSDWIRPGYGGPCPPVGRHRYIFRLYALDIILPEMHRAKRAAVEQAMKGHIIGTAELIGTYKKRGRCRPAQGLPNSSGQRIVSAR